ncbi:hypothetical protein IW138_003591 [Coemansia sp. RSA 986]|nr:hypothetical protein IW138_003591 [Coemansia sp. RSA 986]
MKRQSGLGLLRQGADARGTGGSSYFQRRVQPLTSAGLHGQQQQYQQETSGGASLSSASQAPSTTSKPDTSASASGTASAKEKHALQHQQYSLNAIAVLTNQPSRAPARIHRSELPTVPRTHYSKIAHADFDGYVQKIEGLFDQYDANVRSGYQIATDDLDRYEAAVEDAEKVLEAASHTYSMDSTTMAERLKALDPTRSEFGLDSVSEYGGKGFGGTVSSVHEGRKGARGDGDDSSEAETGGRGAERRLPGIEDIPAIFFEESFDLRDPPVFDIVTQVVLGPQTATDGLFSPDRSAEISTSMQELLSEYMDVVETYLTREISRRSPSFFAALSTLKELHAETDNCIGKIHALRDDLKKTAHAQCAPGLKLIRLRRRRDNLATVMGQVEVLSNLWHIQPTVEELVGSGDYIGALNLLTEAQETITSSQVQPHSDSELSGTRAFEQLSARTAASLKEVSAHAEHELATIIRRDMREFVDDGLSGDGLLGQSQLDIYQANLSMQLMPLVCGLAQTSGIASALKTYRAGMMAEATALIEGLYPDGFPRSLGHANFSDAAQQRALGAAVRNQTFDQFRALISQQQVLLLLIISHVSTVRRAILEILDDNHPAGNGSNQPQALTRRYDAARTEVVRSLNDTFDAFMDVAHMRCAKLLNHRSEQNARLGPAGFHSLYSSIWAFVAQYELLGGKMCFGLRGTLTAQAKAFLGNFHVEKSRQIQILIENEQWVQAEVPIDFQNLVDQVIRAAAQQPHTDVGADQNAPGAPLTNSPLVLGSLSTDAAQRPVEALARQDSDAASVRSADTAGIGLMHIGSEAFHVVGCSLVLVKSVVEYLQCAVSMPVLATDVLQRLVDMLKTFNSRTCQVVLGAGAMHSAGLKNISAKHIALASESLAMCMELIPYAKECLRHVMAHSQEALLSQLDRTVNDFVNHQQELHRKLVAIMTDRADYHARMLGATRWDDLGAELQAPVPAMDGLVKEVRKLHKVLRRYLPAAVLRSVFAQIFTMYESKLTTQLRRVRITSSDGKRQLMLNAQLLLRRLRALDTALPVDWELEVVVNNIDLVKPYQSAADADQTPVPASDGNGDGDGDGNGNGNDADSGDAV